MAEEAERVKENITEELDQVIPKHQLLDNTAAKHKNELVHRGTLATRHRPSGEGLRTQILRRQFADSKEGSPVETCKEHSVPPTSPSHSKVNSKNNSPLVKKGKSFLADIQATLNTKCNEDSPDKEEQTKDKPSADKSDDKSPIHSPAKGQIPSFLSGIKKAAKRQESETPDKIAPAPLKALKPKDDIKEVKAVDKSKEDSKDDGSPLHSPSKVKRPSFLAGIENAVKRKDSEATGEPMVLPTLRKVKPKPKLNPIVTEESSIQDQLRLKLEARKKLVDETDEGAETET